MTSSQSKVEGGGVPALSGHLDAPEGRAQVSFHPACPICRQERVLRSKGLVGLRVPAALAAGLLAFGAAAPAVAFAAEGDQEQVGSLAPAQTGTGDPALSPDFDPGGDSTDLPGNAAPVPQVEAPPDPGSGDA